VGNQQLQTKTTLLKLKALKKLLVKFGGYFDGNMYRFLLDEKGQLSLSTTAEKASLINDEADVTSNGFSPSIIIVARKHYQEKVSSYPVENKRELTKLLTLQYNEQENVYYHINPTAEGKSTVNSWHFEHQVPSAYIIIPETVLLTADSENNQIVILSREKRLFAVRSNGLVQSSQQTAVINASQRFAESTGLPFNHAKIIKDKIIKPDDFVSQLLIGTQQLAFRRLIACFRPLKIKQPSLLAKKIMIPFFSLTTIYIVLSSSYLLYQDNTLQSQLAAQKSQVSESLNQQQLFDNNIEYYLALTDFLKEKQSRSPIWLVLMDIFPQAQFTNIQLQKNRYILRGKTAKATDLLETISNNVNVVEAKFDSPSRSTKDHDLFVISFLLTPDLSFPDTNTNKKQSQANELSVIKKQNNTPQDKKS
jgi:hypothetical protein